MLAYKAQVSSVLRQNKNSSKVPVFLWVFSGPLCLLPALFEVLAHVRGRAGKSGYELTQRLKGSLSHLRQAEHKIINLTAK